MLQKLNENVLSMARGKGAFRRRSVAAIDPIYIPYYGKPTLYVVQEQYKLETTWFHCYAAIRIVERGRRYLIKSRWSSARRIRLLRNSSPRLGGKKFASYY